jgi:hypothetical protein
MTAEKYFPEKNSLFCEGSIYKQMRGVDIKGYYDHSRFWLLDNRNRDHDNHAGSCVRMWSLVLFPFSN